MKFSDQLNEYLQLVRANQKELADTSGFSRASVSRLCSGKKEPSYNSKELERLADAICTLGKKHNIDIPSYEEIFTTLRNSVDDMLHVDYDVFLKNLKFLLKYLGVKNTELANGIHSDLSHVSRILAGTGNPGSPSIFIHDVATYLALRYTGSNEIGSIAKLLDVSIDDIATSQALRDHLVYYLGSHSYVEVDHSIPHFLTSFDTFNLDDYLKAVHFDEIKIPPAVPHLSTRKEYIGIQKMMNSEIDFMKTTVLSKSQEDCILYSDMPLEDMAADPEFPKKYMLGMAMMLKKGLHLHVIHDVNRPFREMMLGLESWIPLYMTGQISPYYLPASQSQVFMHFLKVSGAAALEGSAITGNQASGKYILYRSKEDVAHYRTRAEQLLNKALPLMDIYQKREEDAFHAMQKKLTIESDLKLICSGIPLYFLPEELLTEVLHRVNISDDSRSTILRYYEDVKTMLPTLLETNKIHLVLPDFHKAASNDFVPTLSLSDVFLDENITLTEEEYRTFLDSLGVLKETNSNFYLEYNPSPAFSHINIAVIGDHAVIVSKEKSPTIHFVIYHKKMVRAFQDFIPPLVEE